MALTSQVSLESSRPPSESVAVSSPVSVAGALAPVAVASVSSVAVAVSGSRRARR